MKGRHSWATFEVLEKTFIIKMIPKSENCFYLEFLQVMMHQINMFVFLFYQSFLSWTVKTHRTAGEEETIFYSTLPLPIAHEYSDIYLNATIQCMLATKRFDVDLTNS